MTVANSSSSRWRPRKRSGPLQANLVRSRPGGLGIANRNDVHIFASAFHQASEHSARPELDEQLAPQRDKFFDAIDPAHGAGDLLLQRSPNIGKRFDFV